MAGLMDAVLLGAGLSLLAGLAGWIVARALRPLTQGAEVAVWRTVRLVAVLPVLLAPLIWAVPQSLPLGGDLSLPALQPVTGVPGEFAATQSFSTPNQAALPDVRTVLAWTYVTGLGVMLLLALRRHVARQRLMARSRPASREERWMLDSLARRLGLAAPELRIGRPGVSPFLTGWTGVIVVPDGLHADAARLRCALTHELCHLRRGDERDRLVGTALAIVFWFHLPLRLIERELDAAREMACDREAVAALGGARRDYAAALIDMMRLAAPAVSAFGPHDRRHREMRIQSILNETGPRQGRAVLLAATFLAGAVPLAGAQALMTERRVAAEPVEIVETAVATPRAAFKDGRGRFGPAPEPVTAPEPVELAFGEPAPAPAVEDLPFGEPAPAVAPHPHAEPHPAAHVEPVRAPQVPAPQHGAQGSHPHTPQIAPAPELVHPVADGRISSRYGDRPARPAGAPRFHHGYDIAAPRGTAVAAPGAGTVVHAGAGYLGSEAWGNTIAIDHGDGWQTVYAHLEGFDVAVGDVVAAGQQIGRVGATGRATGPHVHVELHFNGERVDPSTHVPGLR